jgi:hypothetical protein
MEQTNEHRYAFWHEIGECEAAAALALRHFGVPADQTDELLQKIYGQVLSGAHGACSRVRPLFVQVLRQELRERGSSPDIAPSVELTLADWAALAPLDEPHESDTSRMLAVLHGLPPLQRQIYTLVKVYGWSEEQVAAKLNTTIADVVKHTGTVHRLVANGVLGRASTIDIAIDTSAPSH